MQIYAYVKNISTGERNEPHFKLKENKKWMKVLPSEWQNLGLRLTALTSLSTRDETAEFASSVDLDEVAHTYNEPPHLDLHCLPSSL